MSERLPAAHPDVQAALGHARRSTAGHKHSVARARKTRGARGHLFDSKIEAAFSHELEAERRAGLIVDWWPKPSLVVGVDERGRDVRYTADFMTKTIVDERESFDVIDVKPKGGRVDSNRDKRAALRARGIDVRVERR